MTALPPPRLLNKEEQPCFGVSLHSCMQRNLQMIFSLQVVCESHPLRPASLQSAPPKMHPLELLKSRVFLLLLILEKYLKWEQLEILEERAPNLESYSLRIFSFVPKYAMWQCLTQTTPLSFTFPSIFIHIIIFLMLTEYIPFLIAERRVL